MRRSRAARPSGPGSDRPEPDVEDAAAVAPEAVAELRAELEQVRTRLARSEREVQELRALGFRVAELADLVTELLAGAAAEGGPAFRQAVDRYADGV